MALSKDEIQLLKEMIADDSISNQEKDMYRDMLGETPATASKPAMKKATKKKSKPKKKKVSESDIDKMKAQIKQRTGKTEEECEKIVEEYRALRKKATTRKKKETATKEKSKQRTTKLKKEGKVIEGTTEKNVEATIDTATKTATKKVDKEITKIEKSTKGEKQVEKKIDQLVKKALASSKKFVSDMAKELSTKSKTDGKTYLLGLRSQIDALLKKYELGGEVFDGSGDSINFGSGGFTSSYNIQEGMISVGNNVKFEEGGDVFDGSGDSVNYEKGGNEIDLYEILQNVKEAQGESDFYYELQDKYGAYFVDDEELEEKFKEIFYNYDENMSDYIDLPFAKGGTLHFGGLKYKLTKEGVVKEARDINGKLLKEVINKGKKYRRNSTYKTYNSVKGNELLNKSDIRNFEEGGEIFDGSGDSINFAKGGKIDKDIAKFKKQLIAKEKSRGLYENFGQNEVRKLNDKYDVYEMGDDGVKNYTKIQEFSDWASGFDGTRYEKGGMSQGYNDRLDESLGSRRGTAMSHHQNYKDRRDESKGMETGMGRRAYRGVDTMDNN